MGLSLGTEFDDPRTQGILALGLGLLGSRGGFAQSLGTAGAGAMGTYREAQQAVIQRRQQAAQMEMQQMQLAQARKAQEDALLIQAAARRRMQSPDQVAMGQVAAAGLPAGPTTTAAALAPNSKPGMDLEGFNNDLFGINVDKGMALRASLQKDDTPVALAEGGRLVTRGGKLLAENPKAPELTTDQRNFAAGQADPRFNPWLMDTKRAGAQRVQLDMGQRFENSYSTEQGQQFAKVMSSTQEAGAAAKAGLIKLDRMDQLLNGVDGGKFAPAGKEVASALYSLGVKIDPKLGNKEAAAALATQMAMGSRQPGTGVFTDKDFAAFLETIPDLSKTPEGRRQISATMRAAHNREIQIAGMAREYERKNGRLDNGWYEMVANHVAQNPVVARPAGMPLAPEVQEALEFFKTKGVR